jgi:hypothetical protein
MPRDEEILKRRARFVSAALVLAGGCTREKEGASPLPAAESAKAKTPDPPVTPPPKVQPPPDRPSLDATVSPAAKTKLTDAQAEIEKIYAGTNKLAGAVPAPCALDETSCHARFKAFADELAKLRDEVYQLGPPRCPAKLPDDKAIETMVDNHRRWLSTWLANIEKVATTALDAGTAWEDMRREAAMAYPHPCLKFACP